MRLLWILCLLFCQACRSSLPDPAPDALRTAQLCMDMGDIARSREILKAYLKRNPDSIQAWRLYQDASWDPGGRSEFQKLCDLCPASVLLYLKAREIEEPEKRRAALQLLKSEGELKAWIHMDLAHLALEAQQYPECRAHLESVFSYLPHDPKAHLMAAWLALREVNWAKALSEARQAHDLNPYLIEPYFFEAAHRLSQEDYAGTIHTLKKVELLFPGYSFSDDERYGYFYAFWQEILSLLNKKLYQNAIRTTEEALAIFPDHPLFLTLKAEALWETGELERARTCLKNSLDKDPYRLRTVQLYRRALIREGRYEEAYALWEPLVPKAILYHPDNEVKDRYVDLSDAIAAAQDEQPETLIRLARAMARAGWEEEACLVYDRVSDPHITPERDSLRRHVKFIKGMRDLVYASYQRGKWTIVDLIAHINVLARENEIPLYTTPGREFDSYFIVVREADPFAPESSSLGGYLAIYNKFLDLGNSYGHIEARLMNRISVREHRRRVGKRWHDYRVIIGDETEIDSFAGYHSGSPKTAGRAFLSSKGFYIALDTIRPNLSHLQEIYRHLENPELPEVGKLSEDYFTYSQGIADALLRRSLQPIYPELTDLKTRWPVLYREVLMRKLDIVHNHELGHLVDFLSFLPVYAHLGELIAMLVREGFSPQNIQTRFELMAETFGLAHTAYPHYYLHQEMERLDVGFEGIFTWVPWAWYGRLPSEDPYYLSAVSIFQGLAYILDESGDPECLMHLHQYSRHNLWLVANMLCRRYGISR